MNLQPTLEVEDFSHENTEILDETPLIEESYWAILINQFAETRNIKLEKDPFTIGRGSANDFMINDKRLSNQHCRIEKSNNTEDANQAILYDLSSNGTFVNDQKIGKNQSTFIKHGDRIVLLRGSKIPKEDEIVYEF